LKKFKYKYMANNSTNSGSIGFPTLLFLVFLILKLTNVITWSWWWVFSPIWISFILGVIIIGLVLWFKK